MKIGLALFLTFILSFTPLQVIVHSGMRISGYFRWSLYINHVANFFIYLVVDEEFRAKLKTGCFKGNAPLEAAVV